MWSYGEGVDVLTDVPAPERTSLGGRPPKTGWEKKYLKYVRLKGAKVRAARFAGISYRTAERRASADPKFAAAVEQALQSYADWCEEQLVAQAVEKGNPVGLIVRLKALRPELYIEKHAVMNINANVSIEGADGVALLRQMLGQATPSTQRAIVEAEGHVVEGEGGE